ncbi:hypothetical protein diail_670 [Diaporthe ilicicola]|nr:hypothetical protein diail_670 [Diaporthe ilicicola]
MDPFSLTVGTVGLIGAVNSCLKLAAKFVGPSKFGSAELAAIKGTLYEALGILTQFETYVKIHGDDDGHRQTLVHLKPVMERCGEALQSIETFIRDTSAHEKMWKGAKFDKAFKTALAAVDESSKLFKLAVMADQQSLILGVAKYLEVVGQDVEAIKKGQEETRNDSSYALIRAWLGAQADNDMNSQRHQDHACSRFPGSCEWLDLHVDFVNWVESPPYSNKMEGIWLQGSPGAGKSYVCSKAIDRVAMSQNVYLYYFYRFDNQFSTYAQHGRTTDESKLQMSSLLTDQLLRQLCRDDVSIANHIYQSIEVEEKNTKTLARVVQMLLKKPQPEGSTAPRESRTAPSLRRKIYLLLDGLDEAQGSFTGRNLLNVALDLFRDLQDEVCLRFWVSSQDNMELSKSLLDCAVINFDDQAEAAVRDHIARVVPKTIDLNFDLKECDQCHHPVAPWVLHKLQTRAKGNFLYAKLAIDQLSGIISPEDLTSFLSSEIPDYFTDMYERIFSRY